MIEEVMKNEIEFLEAMRVYENVVSHQEALKVMYEQMGAVWIRGQLLGIEIEEVFLHD